MVKCQKVGAKIIVKMVFTLKNNLENVNLVTRVVKNALELLTNAKNV